MFRPAFEALERREVLSANFAGISADNNPLDDNGHGTHLQPVVAVGTSRNEVRVAAGDINGDGRADLLALRDGTSNVLIALLLPFIEQDNIYRIRDAIDVEMDNASDLSDVKQNRLQLAANATAHDALFADLGEVGNRLPRGAEPNQIIAILIGLVQSPGGAPTGAPGEANSLIASPEFFGLSAGTYGRNTATAFDRGYLFP